MQLWIGLGLGVLIGGLLGVLIAALALQSRVKAAQARSPELSKVRAEREALQFENDQIRAESARLREEVRTLDDTRMTDQSARTSLEHELATLRPMLTRATSEKDNLLMEMIGLRSEVDQLKATLAAMQAPAAGEQAATE